VSRPAALLGPRRGPPSPRRRETPRDFSAIAERLRRGVLIFDRRFDEIFPVAVRRASCVHWTPVEVAVRVSHLLTVVPSARILDIGSGVGKFCLVAAAASTARVTGIEHRTHFVDIARDAATKLGVDVDFRRGSIEDLDPAAFDGIYLFNPFAENLASPEDHLDKTVELNETRFHSDVETTERFLASAPYGTRVVTYCGFGGQMPGAYVLERRERCAGIIEVWVKRSSAPSSARR
jgi:SAM-dependent methyltransferase